MYIYHNIHPTMSARALVDEQVKALSSICELESDVTQAFHAAMLPIAERHLTSAGSSSPAATGGEKIKLGKKAGTKRASKPKEEKLSSKNGYHFFVAAKMSEVKAQGVEAKGRMKKIGEMWKALSEADRQPYKNMAARYNEHVGTEMKTSDWKARKEAIVAAANSVATTGTDVPVSAAALADAEVDEDDGASVATTVTVASVAAPVAVAVPAPVAVAVPAPVQEKAPVRKKAGKAK
jgi:hypothetical protein